MRNTVIGRRPAVSAAPLRAASLALVVLLVLGSGAWGQTPPAEPKPSDEPAPAKAEDTRGQTKPPPAAPTDSKAQSDKPTTAEKKPAPAKRLSSPKAKPRSTRGAKNAASKHAHGKKGRGQVQLTPDPNAKYLCEQTSVELPPVWRGEATMTFPFRIKNVGTADLKIRAKGG